MKEIILILTTIGLLTGCANIQDQENRAAVKSQKLNTAINNQSESASKKMSSSAAWGSIGEQPAENICPLCFRQFSSAVEFCPYDGMKLEQKP